MTVRYKKYDLRVGDVRQIKVRDNEKPVRFIVESGAFTYDHLVGDQTVSTATAISSGVVAAPGDCWGTEIRINCTTAGILHVAHIG